MAPCEHADFVANVAVNRLLDTGRFAADIRVGCAHCGEAFRFLGAPAGISYARPMVSVDGTELRCPIEPEGEKRFYRENTIEVEAVGGDDAYNSD